MYSLLFKVCYKVLGLNENCSQKELKQAFVELAKKHHPDSSQEVDTAKFQLVVQVLILNYLWSNWFNCDYLYKIENAYRKLQEKFRIDTERLSALGAKQDDHQDIRNSHQDSEQSHEHDIEVFYLWLDKITTTVAKT